MNKKKTIYEESQDDVLPKWKYLRYENADLIYEQYNGFKQLMFCI